MKSSKKLKLVLQILICILIILIGLGGIYVKEDNMYKSILPKYTLSSDIKGNNVFEFEVDTSKEIVYLDKEGNEVDSSKVTEENKKDYTTKEVVVNLEENLNKENYNKTIKILEERLKFLGADQYQIDLDENTGKIAIYLEDDFIEDIETMLPREAKLQLKDLKTEEVILDYRDFKSAEATYASLIQEVRIYMNLNLNETGLEKIKNIDKYKENKESKLIFEFDGEKIAEVSYDDILLNGKTLRITTAKKLTTDSEINSKLNLNIVIAKLATIGKLPVIYNLSRVEFINSANIENINNIVKILIAGVIGAFIVILFRYKLKGILAIIGYLTNISLFLILIRITKVPVSLNGFAGIFGLIILNVILMSNILESIKEDKTFLENIKGAYLKTMNALVIMLIVFIVLALSSMTVISTAGLLLFWGWLITILGTLVFTVPMLAIVKNK